MYETVTLLVLANEDRVRFLENRGAGRGLTDVFTVTRAELEEAREEEVGRIAVGAPPHVYERRTRTEERLREIFASDLAEILAERASSAPFDRLVIAAPPRVLSLLRAALPRTMRRRLVFDIERDLMEVPAAGLPAFFTRGTMF